MASLTYLVPWWTIWKPGSVGPFSLCMWSLSSRIIRLHGCLRLQEQAFQELRSEGCHSYKVWLCKLALHHFCKVLLIKAVTELTQIQGMRAWIPFLSGCIALPASLGRVSQNICTWWFLIILGMLPQCLEPQVRATWRLSSLFRVLHGCTYTIYMRECGWWYGEVWIQTTWPWLSDSDWWLTISLTCDFQSVLVK